MVVLPEPVGPVTRMMPCGRAISCFQRSRVVRAEAQRLDALDRGVGVEDAHHHLLAEGGGQGRQAHLDLGAAPVDAVGALGLDAAVQRAALLDHVHAAEQLDARGHRVHHAHAASGRRCAARRRCESGSRPCRAAARGGCRWRAGRRRTATASRPPAPRPGRWRRAACWSCPVRPAARSWPPPSASPVFCAARTELRQREELGRVACDVLRVGQHQPHRLARVRLDLGHPGVVEGLGGGDRPPRQGPPAPAARAAALGVVHAHHVGHAADVDLQRVDAQVGQPKRWASHCGQRLGVQQPCCVPARFSPALPRRTSACWLESAPPKRRATRVDVLGADPAVVAQPAEQRASRACRAAVPPAPRRGRGSRSGSRRAAAHDRRHRVHAMCLAGSLLIRGIRCRIALSPAAAPCAATCAPARP